MVSTSFSLIHTCCVVIYTYFIYNDFRSMEGIVVLANYLLLSDLFIVVCGERS